MAILADFGDMLPHDITWQQRTGQDDYGKPTFAAPITFKARVDKRTRIYNTPQGETLESQGTVVVGGTPPIKPGDLVTLPGGDQPTIVDAWTQDDMEGVPYHTELIFG